MLVGRVVMMMMMMMMMCVLTELGGDDEGVTFDPSKLDPDRCESCYGAETEDLK